MATPPSSRGMATTLVPLVIGVEAYSPPAEGQDRRHGRAAQRVGFAVSGVGPALGPIVGHVVLGEWGRAAAFGAPPIAAEVALSAYLAAMPDAAFQGTAGARASAFGLLYSADLFGAAIGVLDVMMAHERARRRQAWPGSSRGRARAAERGGRRATPGSWSEVRCEGSVLVVTARARHRQAGCVVVPQNRRARLADPMMALSPDSLEAHRKAKLYSSREGAAGGDGATAGRRGAPCQ